MDKDYSCIIPAFQRMFFVVSIFMSTFGMFILPSQHSAQANPSSLHNAITTPDALGILAFEELNVTTLGANTTSLRAINATGSGYTTLASANRPPLFCGEPAWSPDGTKIVYRSDLDIHVMDANGNNKVLLTNNGYSGVEGNPSWSATNKIAYERENQIWTMNPDGTNQARFAAITQITPRTPAWSPDGTKLAYASGGGIWVINADGTGERLVTNNSTYNSDPQWSPDGTKIIFGTNGSGIAVINLDGTNQTNLTNVSSDSKPAWSDDGTRIAFIRRDGANGGIFTMNADGTNQVRIRADQVQIGSLLNDNPAWQPLAPVPNTAAISGRITRVGASLGGVTVNLFGTTNATTTTDGFGFYRFNNLPQGGNYTVVPRLANNIFTPNRRVFDNLTTNQIGDFTATTTCSVTNCAANGKIAYAANDGNLYTANPDGSNAVQLTNVQRDNEPMWSPDGTKIVFESSRDILAAPEIYKINADGSNLTRLTNNTNEDEYPSFSPDGTKILFVSNRDGNREIYQMNADGTNQMRLTNDVSDDRYPKYSPDGTKIVFTRFLSTSRGLHTMNADGTNVVQITLPPVGNMDNNASYSPDGTKIVFTRGIGGPSSNQICTVNSNGSSLTILVANGFNFKPSYAPDGTKILFTSFGGLTYYVQTVSLSGITQQLFTGGARADWQPIRAAIRPTPFDFDGDGRADVSVFRPSNGTWYTSQNAAINYGAYAFGFGTDQIVPGDYDGDGKTDIAVFRPSAGYWYIQGSQSGFRAAALGFTNDIPVPADYDGDGKTDAAVFRPSNGIWYIQRSSLGSVTIAFGLGTDKPVPGDYDGDGKAEVAVFRPSTGYWYTSQNPAINYGAVLFGVSEDKPVPADYDGDGKTDIAVFRPSNGTWYLLQSSAGFTGMTFGFGTDLPTAADYDGDGRADIAVFRNGSWYLNRTTSGFTGIAFGVSTDQPIPNIFVR